MRILLKIGAIFFPSLIEWYSKWYAFFISNLYLTNSISVINTQDQGGGAAKIAYVLTEFSIHKKQIRFFVNEKKRENKGIVQLPLHSKSRVQRWFDEMERFGSWLDISKIAPLKLLKSTFYNKSTIVHLHNLHGYYFSYAILPVLLKGKRVIWTLHDEQLLTGHCSCTLNCNKWMTGCGACPNLDTYPAIKTDSSKELLKYKVKWLKQINPVIVCPSIWLSKRVKMAFPFLSNILVIPNGVDTNVFMPSYDKIDLRNKLNLPINSFLIIFAAELSTSNPFKGGDLINGMLEDGLGEDSYLITIGGGTSRVNSSHIPFGYLENELEMAELYAAADLMIYPTKADNLPLVVLEAMSAGLPVSSSNIGGISEIIRHNENGFLIDSSHDKMAFKNSIINFRNYSIEEKQRIARNARTTIVENFSAVKMIKTYDELYASLFENKEVNKK